MWKVTNQSDTEAEVFLYDVIADFDSEQWGYVSAKSVINKIKALGKIENITLRINSYGGDVFQAQAMYNYLKSHPATVTVRVDGLAASAASMVAMAGDKIIMPENSLMMIHNPAGGVVGEAKDMRDTADVLDKIRDLIVGAYAAKTGQPRDKLIDMMDNETWLTATEAHDLKFCDEVAEAVEIAAVANKGAIIYSNGFGFARADESLCGKMPKHFVNFNPKPKSKEEKSEMEIKNVAELEAAYPDFVNEIRNAAVNTERGRLKALDDLNAPGRESIIAKAKYEEPRDVRDIAVELLKADGVTAKMNALHQDAGAVNGALSPHITPNANTEREVAMSLVLNEMNRMRGIH